MNPEARADFAVRGCLLLACSLLSLAVAVIVPDGKSFAAQGFNWYINPGMHNLLDGRLAYAVFCVALIVCALCIFRCKSKLVSLIESLSSRLVIALSTMVAVLGLVSIYEYCKSFSVVAVSAGICVLASFAWRNLPRRITGILAISLAAVVFFAAVVPGLSELPDLSRHTPESLAEIEAHQALSTAAEQRLAQGSKLFEATSARYGVLWQSVLATCTKLVNPLSVGDSIMFVRWLQSLFFACAAVAYWRFSRRAIFAAALAVLFIAPWMELKQQLFWFPQVTSWRYFGFAVAPAVVIILEHTNVRLRSFLLGALSTIVLLSDLASGFSVTLGLIVYVVFRRDKDELARLLSLFFAGMLCALFAFMLFFGCVFGYLPPFPAVFSALKRIVWECAGGTAPALRYPFDPLAIVILLHTSYAGLKLAGKGIRSLAPRDALRLCICVVSLIWFVHYVNEPNTFALRASRVLYGFLLVDLLRTLAFCVRRKRLSEPLVILNTFLVAIIIPAAVMSYQPAAEKLVSIIKNEARVEPGKMLVSGVFLQEDVGRALIQKSQYLRKMADHSSVSYLTVDTSFVPKLSGLVSQTPLADPGSELLFSKQSERFVQSIYDSGVQKIFVDDPQFVTMKGVGRISCFAYLRVLLARHYRLLSSESGWQIWVLKEKSN